MFKRLFVVVSLLLFTATAVALEKSLQGHPLPAYFYTTTGLNVRDIPHIKGKKLKTLPKHTEVYVIRLATNGFCQVRYGCDTAFVSCKYLTFSRVDGTKKQSFFSGNLNGKWGIVPELMWNTAAKCHRWLHGLIGDWVILVGLILLIVGWLILDKQLAARGTPLYILLMAILPVVVAFKNFVLYNPHSDDVWGWIGVAAAAISLIGMVVSGIIMMGAGGVAVGLLSFVILFFGMIFFSLALVFIVVLLVFSIYAIFKPKTVYESSSSTSSNESYTPRGNDTINNDWGVTGTGEKINDTTFINNLGEKYTLDDDGKWRKW